MSGNILRYGKEEGTKRYYEKNKRLSVSPSALRKNGFSDNDIERIRKTHAEKSAITLDNLICKYGVEEGSERYRIYIEENHSTHWSTKYWMKRGYSEEDAKSIISNIQRRDLAYFIKKYGEIDGFIAYESCLNAKIKTSGKSKIEERLYNCIKERYECYHNYLIKGQSRNYLVDVYIPKLNLIVECFGDYWHMNPDIYPDDAFNHHLKMTAKEKRVQDKARIDELENNGYRVLVLWERNLNKNGIEKTVHESIK